ncbi:MAG: hypothetical protein MUF71_18950 [Candidatus Kapabacteria bacterium]|jgi:hypothetical protein|nr:hypothetical protein [Candidatus Kapabacteria bacterium]
MATYKVNNLCTDDQTYTVGGTSKAVSIPQGNSIITLPDTGTVVFANNEGKQTQAIPLPLKVTQESEKGYPEGDDVDHDNTDHVYVLTSLKDTADSQDSDTPGVKISRP